MKLHIDIETFSELDLKKCGVYRYAEHPSTEILCIAYAFDDGPVQIWKAAVDMFLPDELVEAVSKSYLWAHNANFERTVLNGVAGKKIGFPETKIPNWYCTAATAAMYSLPRDLKRCAEVLGVTKKDNVGVVAMHKLCKPRKPTTNNRLTRWLYTYCPEDYEALYRYCKQDVEVERAVGKCLVMPPDEMMLYWIDQAINDQGITVDRELVDAVRSLNAEHKANMNQLFVGITGVKPSQREKLFQWLKARGFPYSDIRAETIDNALKDDLNQPYMTEELRKVLRFRRLSTKTSVAKYDAMDRAMNTDSRVRGMFLYHGASTGRWAGKIVQMQNLPRPNIKDIDTAIAVMKYRDLEATRMMYESPNAVFSSLIRSAFTASPGKELVVSDFSQIEARVLGWLAGEDSYMNAFNTGRDIYKVQAAEIFGIPYENVGDFERQLGKVCVLALGYQMGIKTLIETCKSWGLDIETRLLEQALEGYRKANTNIVGLWGSLNGAALEAMRERGKIIKCGFVRMHYGGRFFTIILPSGRKLFYCDPELRETETSWGEMREALHYMTLDSMTNSWASKHTYGGKLTENIVQAIARDLLATALDNIFRDKKYKILGHVHDEVIAEVDQGTGDLEEFNAMMVKRPAWAKDIPVEADGWIGMRYRK